MIIFHSKNSMIQFFSRNMFDKNDDFQDDLSEENDERISGKITEEFEFETDEEISLGKVNKKKNSVLSSIFDLVEIISYAIALMVVVFLFVIKFVTVDGDSMLNTLHDEERLVIYNLFYTPETNDIVVINYDREDELLVKRVIGVEGDKIKINFTTWEIWVNDQLLDQSYLNDNQDKGVVPMHRGSITNIDENNCTTFTVEEGKVFVMGDNRNYSLDSRSIGQLDSEEILGKVILRVSPFDKAGTVK